VTDRWVVAGIDAGTTTVKGAAIASDGRRVRHATAPVQPQAATAEAFSAESVADAIKRVAESLWPFDCLAIAGMINTHVLVGDDGAVLTPTLGWGDYRARDYATDGWTATSVVARVRYWREHAPEAVAAARWVMVPRDYALLRMTGHASTDRTSWPDLMEHGALAERVPDEVRSLLPTVCDPSTVVSEYRGVPVVAGCMDSLAAVLGVGATPVGTAINVSGTSETVGVVAAGTARTPSVRGTIELPEGWWHAGPTQAGGRAFSWAAQLLAGGERSRFLEMARAPAPVPTGIVFLPYLDGERAPLWDPDAHAAFIGLTVRDGPETVARAVLEGVAFAVRHVLESATPPGVAPDRLVVCGRLSEFAPWNQIKADVTGLATIVPDEAETGARGAAMLAGAGLGGEPVATVRDALAPRCAQLAPDPTNADRYQPLYDSYRELWPAIRAHMPRRLAGSDTGAPERRD
jgi:xylulokinase